LLYREFLECKTAHNCNYNVLKPDLFYLF
jgi:hypothetical protein